MEMVSAAKMKRAIHDALAIRPFHEESKLILKDIVSSRDVKHPLVEKNGGVNELCIVISSHKGLCGGYNGNIYKKLLTHKHGRDVASLDIVAIGKYSEKIAKKLKSKIVLSYQESLFTTKDARSLTKFIVNEYREKKYAKISILYTHFASASTFSPKVTQLLPFSLEGEELRNDSVFEYEPSESQVMSTVIPMMVQNLITSSVLESYASEHSARMFAMKSATDNASELQNELKLYYNRARQDAVTQEIAEITSGAMALSS